MKQTPKSNDESIWQKNIVKTKRKGYFRNIQEVKVVAKFANIVDISASKHSISKIWVFSNLM